MLEINPNTKRIDITRGETGAINFYIPIKDANKFELYKDVEREEYYWYDRDENVVYTEEYEVINRDIKDLEIVLHEFNKDDEVLLTIVEKGDYQNVVKEKSVIIDEDKTTVVPIEFESSDTRFGEPIDKETEYWYDVKINPKTAQQTVIGNDLNGDKIFMLHPEGGKNNE